MKVEVDLAAFLDETQTEREEIVSHLHPDKTPIWNIGRARIGNTRNVGLELIVNGYFKSLKIILADGKVRSYQFEVEIDKLSWITLRIFGSSCTNPICVELNKQPVIERKSVEWCIKALDQCWKMKESRIRQSEKTEAKKFMIWPETGINQN